MPVFIRTILLAFAGLILALIAGLSTQLSQHVTVSQSVVSSTTPQNTESATTTEALATASSTPVLQPPAKKIPSPSKTESAKTPTPATKPAPAAPALSPSALNDLVRGSIVNVLCMTKGGGALNSISASGVMVDPRGVILTNSHVAQYFLLKDYPSRDFVTCTIRTGSPAQSKYTAELLFVSPSWIADNAEKIKLQKPTGNGEHDYALLRITGVVGPDISLPTAFASLPVSIAPPFDGEDMLAAGYPAGFLGGIAVQKDLYATSAVTHVGDLFTFDKDTVDLFSIGSSIVAQQGASGGAVADGNGTLMGIIVTTSDAPDTGGRDLRAISTAYIVRDFQKESGTSIAAYLDGDIASKAHTFAQDTAPALTQKLINAIEK